MKKTLLATAALLIAAAHVVSAQSPPASTTLTIAGKTISVRILGAVALGRKIFGDGGLLSRDPTYPAWRAGANSATTFRTDADLDVGGLHVPGRTYTFYVWVKDPEAWQLIISKQTGQWGLSYNASQDLGRVKMTMAKPPAHVETLNYALSDQGSGKAELLFPGDHHGAGGDGGGVRRPGGLFSRPLLRRGLARRKPSAPSCRANLTV